MRRLPVYFLLDTSGSMTGEPIEALNNALSGMFSVLRSNPHTLDSVWISIITFDRDIKVILPLTELSAAQLPIITCPPSGPTHLGAAIMHFIEILPQEIKLTTPSQKGDWKPLLFIMTDGSPSDTAVFEEAVIQLKKIELGAIIGCAAGLKAKDEALLKITQNVVHLATTDSVTLTSFFKWVSESIVQNSSGSLAIQSVPLPPPPPNINFIV